jgi:hypothetical protein
MMSQAIAYFLVHHTFAMLVISHSKNMPDVLKGEERLGLFILKMTATITGKSFK